MPLPEGRAWLTGSTYGRADADARPRIEDHAANPERLRELLPQAAASLAPHFDDGSVRAWSGVRWASSDRRPLVGEVGDGLWVSTAMGSRGLTFAALCGEWIAARLHGEPRPLEARLAQAIDLVRSKAAHPAKRTGL
ncbi:FAD-dependent oxidoreductase [Ramlibacter terrae]|uniref:FAD-dependent oxidoreductase n=1 Tax=Ramlibacter terrae TaxID=2732511 RepID=A0ABX6P2V1_9BURK|nr:FAD-dependent oxidoreductase [Ramlibacter terrae]